MAWMDHQWGNFVVGAVGGWDWFSLQLDDQTELMLYVLRGPGGETTAIYRHPGARRRHHARPRADRVRVRSDWALDQPAHRRRVPVRLGADAARG